MMAAKTLNTWILIVLALIMFAPVGWANEILQIRSLLANPVSYNAKSIRVAGLVTRLRTTHHSGDRCLQSFVLKDDTGGMKARYATTCPGGVVFLRNGDYVTLDVRFEKLSKSTGLLKVRSVVTKQIPSAF